MVARSLNQVNTDMSPEIQVTTVYPVKIFFSKGTRLGTFIPMRNVFAVDTTCGGELIPDNPQSQIVPHQFFGSAFLHPYTYCCS